jgi:2-haloacid dehalogenase
MPVEAPWFGVGIPASVTPLRKEADEVIIDRLFGQAGTSRRHFLGAAAAVVSATALDAGPLTAQVLSHAIKAVAFDAFAIFDARPVFRLVEEIFPGRGTELSNQWRTRQFEYTWLRNSMRQYTDFWHVTEDALNYAAKQSGVKLNPEQSMRLMSAYLQLKAWPDVAAVVQILQKQGLRLALLTNWTPAMMEACLNGSGLEAMFELQLSTDRVNVFKPDPAAYQMGLDAFHLQKQEIAFVAFGGWDAVGAKAFGYPTYWVNRSSVPAEELGVSADATDQDLSHLPSFIDSLRRV